MEGQQGLKEFETEEGVRLSEARLGLGGETDE